MNQKNTFSVESFLVSIIDTENKVEQLKELGIKFSLDKEIELRRFIHHNLRDVLYAHQKEIEDYGIKILNLECQIYEIWSNVCGIGHDDNCLEKIKDYLPTTDNPMSDTQRKYKMELSYSEIMILAKAFSYASENSFDGYPNDCVFAEFSMRHFFSAAEKLLDENDQSGRETLLYARQRACEITSEI